MSLAQTLVVDWKGKISRLTTLKLSVETICTTRFSV